MRFDDDESSPVTAFIEGLTEFVGDCAIEEAEGYATVESMRVALPVEFYVRPEPDGSGRVAAIESRPASRTLTSVMPVLHKLTLVVEVDRAEQRESSVES